MSFAPKRGGACTSRFANLSCDMTVAEKRELEKTASSTTKVLQWSHVAIRGGKITD